jgi:hypothetical protein
MGDDPMARLRAEADQAREGGKELAGNLWAFYAAAVSQGFTAEQAFTLTAQFLSGLLSMPRSEDA